MNECTLREKALENRLSAEEHASFNSHLTTCASCRTAVAETETASRAINSYVEERAPAPDAAAVAKLLAKAETPMGKKTLQWAVPVAAAAAAVIIGAILMLPSSQDTPKDTATAVASTTYKFELVYPEEETGFHSTTDKNIIEGAKNGKVVRFFNSTLGMNETTTIRVNHAHKKENRFQLVSGIVAAELAHVKNRERLQIVARDLTITVKGTVFWVDLSKKKTVEVGVVRGTVSVQNHKGSQWLLTAGNKLIISNNNKAQTSSISLEEKNQTRQLLHPGEAQQELGELPVNEQVNIETQQSSANVPKSQESNPSAQGNSSSRHTQSLPKIEQWVLNGNYKKAESALLLRLKANNNDKDTLDLLATCYRKQQRYSKAAQMYERLVHLGTPAAQNRAKYRLSVLFQEHLGRHGKAVSMLRSYLATPASLRPNTPEARLRLANSLKHLGRTEEYRQTLQTVITAHPGTRASEKAQQLLRDSRQ